MHALEGIKNESFLIDNQKDFVLTPTRFDLTMRSVMEDDSEFTGRIPEVRVCQRGTDHPGSEFSDLIPLVILKARSPNDHDVAYIWIEQDGINLVVSDALRRELRADVSLPQELFAGKAVRPVWSTRLGYSEVEGFGCNYIIRTDLASPGVAVALSDDPTEILPHTGQSNAAGGGNRDFPEGMQAATTTAYFPHRALTLGDDPYHGSLELIDASRIHDLRPLKETAKRETPCAAYTRWGHTQAKALGRVPRVEISYTNAYGGQRLIDIGPGTNVYANGLLLLRKANEFALAYGARRARVRVLQMDQGEADRPGTSWSEWEHQFAGFRAAAETDFRAITGQPEPVWMVLAQLASVGGESGAGAWTAIPQHRVMLKEPRTTIAMPGYVFQGDYGMKGVHFTPLGHAVRAEYKRKAADIIVAALESAASRGIDPWSLTIDDVRTCLRPDLDRRSNEGNVFYIPLTLAADGTEVVVDTATLPPAPMLGFVMVEGSAGPLTSASLVGAPTAPVIRLETASPGTATFRYAYQGSDNRERGRSSAHGNIRDNCSLTSLAKPGLALRNWLITFETSFP